MFWLLIVILFHRDGTKDVVAQVEPTKAACIAQANRVAVDFHDHPDPDVMGAGFKCDGPMDDPTVRKTKT